MSKDSQFLKKVFIAALLPYFLERDSVWFEKNSKSLEEVLKTQPFFQENLILLEEGQFLKLSEFLRKLDELGYEKVFEVQEMGEFSHLGNTVTIFPVNFSYPIRIELKGNYLENIEKLSFEEQNEKRAKERLIKNLKNQKAFSDLKNLKPGEYLVHLDHGIGKFVGFKKITLENKKLSYYCLEYANKDELYVPFGLERKLSRYVSFSEPKLSRLGSNLWQRTKKRIKEEAEKLAKELLNLYAKREISWRPPYLRDPLLEKEVAASFGYEETPDQIKVMAEIEDDLQSNKPMDRIVCGDVGFGKTEIALRTMAKAAIAGYQAALICPTTILAHQHYENFKKRFQQLPFNLALLSRLQTKKEQKEILEKISEGKIDLVIGTHRLLSKDVKFKKLQLLVIDEEQRFGVKQKEKFKELRTNLDILSLSATPIPRTLSLALASLREISFIHTPPPDRKSIKTEIKPWSRKIIAKAINFELKRRGRVYYLHNLIENINSIKKMLEEISLSQQNAQWKIAILHGKMKEKEIIETLKDFQEGKTNILVSTTIIENGIDLPQVNTLIVADATKLGLAQAYQIRGRIGRGPIQSFAYFLYPGKLQRKAKLRLKALKENEELGSGYKIALKDLEIRGAGNVLGKEQSGNIKAVGLNLYCQLISQAVEKIKEEEFSKTTTNSKQ
jgi:transcription-repair coupling factor (superfamily II helicase)